MRLVRSRECDAKAVLRDFVARLRSGADVTSPASDARTVAAFGEPISPQEAVARIVEAVRTRGDRAVIDLTRVLDGVALTPETMWVPPSAIRVAYDRCPAAARRAMERAAANIRAFQSHILQHPPAPVERDGMRLTQRLIPVARVGICVPASAAPLPSSLLMSAVPAQVAGVGELVVASAPGPDGEVRAEVRAAAAVAGVDRVLRVGGATAVAALALGTETIPRVDKVVGPGNIFVALAKRAVFGLVDIDLIAGPSEVLIIADETANPAAVAADLLAQAEHDPGVAVLVTTSDGMARAVQREVDRQLPLQARRDQAARCLDRFGLLIVAANLDEAADLANAMAPEHLEVQVADPTTLVPGLVNAGTIFVGAATPTAVGDYLAGPSHVLPTGGTARFAGGLTANDFLRSSSVIEMDEVGLAGVADDVIALARAEGLDAHARSVEVRQRQENDPQITQISPTEVSEEESPV